MNFLSFLEKNLCQFFVFLAMSMAGKLYFDAMAKIGENAAISPVSRELGKFPCCSLCFGHADDFPTFFVCLTLDITAHTVHRAC